MPKAGETRAAWSTRKKDNAPRGLFRNDRGVWSIRYTCARRCPHEEPVGDKSKALRIYHQRRARALSEPGWCPKSERQAARAQALTVQQYADENWLPSRIGELKPRTHDHYVQVFRDYIYPTLGNIPLRELTRPLLKTWLSQVRRLKGRKQ